MSDRTEKEVVVEELDERDRKQLERDLRKEVSGDE